MFNRLSKLLKYSRLCEHKSVSLSSTRTFLSQAYYCNEVWEHRLRNPILRKINVNELYQELDQRFYKTSQISAVDVDIFTNAAKEESYIDEVMDLIHKLRISASASNILESTPHAAIRLMLQHHKYKDLLKYLDDRLNYGLFVDYYTSNLLMDIFYKTEDYSSGARVASQLMLQEEYNHPLSVNLGLLHCYKYVLNPEDWPKEEPVEEPEEEIKIRVKYLRNPYFDDHFDLCDPKVIVGKALWMFTKGRDNILDNSLHLLGLELHGKTDKVNIFMRDLISNNKKVYVEVLNILPEDNTIRKTLANNSESGNIEQLLIDKVTDAERKNAEKDVALQCEKYSKWEHNRKEAVEEQYQKLLVQQRLANIESMQQQLKDRETKLWFFENEEKLELAIEAKEIVHLKQAGTKKTTKEIDEEYIPPEVK